MVTTANGEQYLVLPNKETWDDDANDRYNSDAMFIRKPYVEIARGIIEHAEISTSRRTRMTLSGASDTGKSFFLRYFVWLLFHPPPGVSEPDIILWKHAQGGVKGDIYCFGLLYSVINVPEFVVTDICEDLMYKRDAWIIYDGEPPQDPPIRCTILAAFSPEDVVFTHNASHIKEHEMNTYIKLPLPAWCLAELLEVGRTIQGLSESELAKVAARYMKVGGRLPEDFRSQECMGISSTDLTKGGSRVVGRRSGIGSWCLRYLRALFHLRR
jgi:hypothetical protein